MSNVPQMETALPVRPMLEPEDRVLSTLNHDGSRRWLRPRLSPGRFLAARRWVGWVLIVIFVSIPHLRLLGKPVILLDVVRREFTLFGYTFLPTDTLLLALLIVGVIVGIFLITALLGRVWCGWGCPQTVYMEFVFRPLERLFDGRPARGGTLSRSPALWRTVSKYLVFLIVSFGLANTFLAYFVGAETLAVWMRQSPFHHPTPFLIVAITTALMMFDFCFFREQTCTLCCPYGRFQSVMLDRDSLVISYDRTRGEPRGPLRSASPATESGLSGRTTGGDCVDCGLCAETCPTGIDIRDGLQMECIGCAQCIDACDAVMTRIHRPLGLIRYSSQARIAGQPGRLLRARVVLYPVILVVLATAFVLIFMGKQSADVTLLRGLGRPFVELPDGGVANQIRIKVTNRGKSAATYSVDIANQPDARLVIPGGSIRVSPGQSAIEAISIVLPRTAFHGGTCDTRLRVSDGGTFSQEFGFRLLGPAQTDASPSSKGSLGHG